MIKFFRKIRQKLLSEKRLSSYVTYAVGEVVLVGDVLEPEELLEGGGVVHGNQGSQGDLWRSCESRGSRSRRARAVPAGL